MAAQGGGIRSGSELTIINSTIAENIADASASAGDGRFLRAVGGGGVAGNPVLQNSIVARNTVLFPTSPGTFAQGGPDCMGRLILGPPPNEIAESPISLGNNIVGDPTDCGIVLLPTDRTGDPGLGALVDSGAPGTGRFPLLQASQAIDAANDDVCASDPALATDQLDTPRNGPCDIGAVEFYPVVNDLMALANITTAFDPTPVPGGPAGTVHITADFANTNSQAIANPFVEVVELTGENLLLNADGGAGGVGARLTSPNGSSTPLEPGASSTFEFLIGLQRREPFTFFVNMLGEPQTSNSLVE